MKMLENILRHAGARPSARAIVWQDGALSYGELAARAGALAARLGDEDASARPVCIGLRKSPEAVVAMLAALLAGRAYVPLDPGLPAARRVAMIADSGAVLVLGGADAVPDDTGARALPVSLDAVPGGAARIAPAADTADAALLYTSGSTNTPKGVRIGRAALDTFVDWAQGYFGLDQADRAASHAPFGFDISFLDLWAVLAAGGEVHLVPEGQMTNGRYLLQFIAERGITFWQSVPTPLMGLAAELSAAPLPPLALRHLCSTGEALPEATRNLLTALGDRVRLHNIYGCTETNDTFVFSLPIADATGEGQLPIGRALSYVDYLIVDEDLRPVPQGEQGELLTASGAAFTGYTDPELTRAAHVSCEGRSYFRTRDLVVEDSSGILHFVGRTDHTVKLRGIRVDLREVETAIGKLPQVSDALAVVHPCPKKGKQLIAVMSGPEAPSLSVIGLKTHCARHLARQTIPDRFITRSDPLPRNANGKIDRRAVSAALEQLFQAEQQKGQPNADA